jgi:hypothetical protein
MTIWLLQARLSRHLLIWSALSIAAGLVLLFAPPFWQGVGVQALVWGTIDAAIALFGLRALRRRQARAGAHAPQALNVKRTTCAACCSSTPDLTCSTWSRG